MEYLFPKNMRLSKMLVWSTFVTEIDTLYYGEQTDIYSDKIPYIYYSSAICYYATMGYGASKGCVAQGCGAR